MSGIPRPICWIQAIFCPLWIRCHEDEFFLKSNLIGAWEAEKQSCNNTPPAWKFSFHPGKNFHSSSNICWKFLGVERRIPWHNCTPSQHPINFFFRDETQKFRSTQNCSRFREKWPQFDQIYRMFGACHQGGVLTQYGPSLTEHKHTLKCFEWKCALFAGFGWNTGYMLPTTKIVDGECGIYAYWPSPTFRKVFGCVIVLVQFLVPLFTLILCYGKIALVLSRRIKVRLGIQVPHA